MSKSLITMASSEDGLHVFRPSCKAVILEGLLEHVKVTDHNGELASHLEADDVSPLTSPLLEGRLEVHPHTEQAADDGEAHGTGGEVLWLLVLGIVDEE